jgi:hypothetical protein
MVTAPAQLSDAVTLLMLTGGTWLAQETVTGGGQIMDGGDASKTFMI